MRNLNPTKFLFLDIIPEFEKGVCIGLRKEIGEVQILKFTVANVRMGVLILKYPPLQTGDVTFSQDKIHWLIVLQGNLWTYINLSAMNQ